MKIIIVTNYVTGDWLYDFYINGEKKTSCYDAENICDRIIELTKEFGPAIVEWGTLEKAKGE